MSGPTNGTIPIAVTTHTINGSSIRRRASLCTQYTVAIQKTSAKKIARFRITYHVDEWKKSWTLPKADAVNALDAITGGSFLIRTPQQTPARRTPRVRRGRRGRR